MVVPVVSILTVGYNFLKYLKDAWRKLTRENPVIAICLALIGTMVGGWYTLRVVGGEEVDQGEYILSALVILSFVSIIIVDLISSRNITYNKQVSEIKAESEKKVTVYRLLLKSVQNKVIFNEMLSTSAHISTSIDKICKGCKGKDDIQEDCRLLTKRIKFLQTNIEHMLSQMEITTPEDDELSDEIIPLDIQS